MGCPDVSVQLHDDCGIPNVSSLFPERPSKSPVLIPTSLFVFWKFFKRTKWYKPHEVDLRKDVREIEEYTENFVEPPPK